MQNSKKTVLATVLFSSLVFAGHAAAKPDWRYVEGGFASYDMDNSFDPDGFTVGGKYSINKNVYLNGELQWLEESGNGFDEDFTFITLGGGYRFPINAATDAYVGANFERFDTDGYDDNGYSLNAGVRSMVTNELELNGELGYYDLGDGDATLKVGANYYFNPNFAVGASYKFIDDADVMQITARYAF